MTNLPYDQYKSTRTYEGRRRSVKRYAFWVLLIIAVFAFCLGVLVGASA